MDTLRAIWDVLQILSQLLPNNSPGRQPPAQRGPPIRSHGVPGPAQYPRASTPPPLLKGAHVHFTSLRASLVTYGPSLETISRQFLPYLVQLCFHCIVLDADRAIIVR